MSENKVLDGANDIIKAMQIMGYDPPSHLDNHSEAYRKIANCLLDLCDHFKGAPKKKSVVLGINVDTLRELELFLEDASKEVPEAKKCLEEFVKKNEKCSTETAILFEMMKVVLKALRTKK